MECDEAREAISALIDGEDPGRPAGVLQAHLDGCESCRRWQQRAYGVTRRARLGGAFLDHDLAPRVLAAVPPRPARRWPALAQRAALLVVALVQLGITVPLLCLGHDPEAGTHAAHEIGSFDLALAIAFLIGAIRPALSAGLAWPCGIAAAGLVATALADLAGGHTIGVDEAQHLIALLGAALLYRQARTGTGHAGPAAGSEQPEAGPHHVVEGQPLSWADGPPDFPGGGADAARLTRPAPTARADDHLVAAPATRSDGHPAAAPGIRSGGHLAPAPAAVGRGGTGSRRDSGQAPRPGPGGGGNEAVA